MIHYMDDTAQSGLSDAGQPDVPASHVPPAPPQPMSGISHGVKEAEPLASPQMSFEAPVVKSSEAEPTLHPEVQEAGVEIVSHQPPLTPEHHAAGVTVSGDVVPVFTQPTGNVQLPMTEQEVVSEIKQLKNVKQSKLWWLMLLLKQFKKLHMKVMNGE